MTKEITRVRILQEIQDKFKLRELTPETFSFLESVVPTYEVSEHLLRREIDLSIVSIVSAPTAYLAYTVPQNERWKIFNFDVVFMAAGAYTITGIYYQRALSSIATRNIYLDMLAGKSVSYSLLLAQSLILDPGDTISIYADSYTSTADLRLYIDVTKEEIR